MYVILLLLRIQGSPRNNQSRASERLVEPTYHSTLFRKDLHGFDGVLVLEYVGDATAAAAARKERSIGRMESMREVCQRFQASCSPPL